MTVRAMKVGAAEFLSKPFETGRASRVFARSTHDVATARRYTKV
jgi:FixJ family two-component response regulator